MMNNRQMVRRCLQRAGHQRTESHRTPPSRLQTAARSCWLLPPCTHLHRSAYGATLDDRLRCRRPRGRGNENVRNREHVCVYDALPMARRNRLKHCGSVRCNTPAQYGPTPTRRSRLTRLRSCIGPCGRIGKGSWLKYPAVPRLEARLILPDYLRNSTPRPLKTKLGEPEGPALPS